MYILQSHRNTVNGVFAFVRAVIAPCHGDTVIIKIKRAVGIVYIKRNLTVTVGTARFGSAENHVLHRLTS